MPRDVSLSDSKCWAKMGKKKSSLQCGGQPQPHRPSQSPGLCCQQHRGRRSGGENPQELQQLGPAAHPGQYNTNTKFSDKIQFLPTQVNRIPTTNFVIKYNFCRPRSIKYEQKWWDKMQFLPTQVNKIRTKMLG